MRKQSRSYKCFICSESKAAATKRPVEWKSTPRYKDEPKMYSIEIFQNLDSSNLNDT
ncbi:hypothetical protein [Lysinibacillus sp. G4S2]|uniref:hypothetical protein n=1 Tax=Lysinibacillus sp. G4S2 TaxID=3055859 RepID=UPI0025A0BF53|nr:hypothetical protein [Lysinibacillus sp. G4S2]MDM5246048.1 hypothetical protein [Lysinibacillus sp. G4S2]